MLFVFNSLLGVFIVGLKLCRPYFELNCDPLQCSAFSITVPILAPSFQETMAGLYPDIADLQDRMEDMTMEEDHYPRVYNAEDWCGDDDEDEDDDGDEEEDDKYNHLLAQLNQHPQVLSILLTQVRDMNASILSLHAARLTLEENLRVTENRVSVLQDKVRTLELCKSKFFEYTVPKTLQLEKEMANISKAQQDPSLTQDSSDVSNDPLKTLRDQAVEAYTPEVCCHFVKREEEFCPTTSDKLVQLAQKRHRFVQIKNHPNSHFWTGPKPLEKEVEERLRSLPPKKQEEQIDVYRTEIRGIFGSSSRKTILLFEMEVLENKCPTVEEKEKLLNDYIQVGHKAQKEMKKQGSLLNTLAGHKKTKK